MIELEPHMSEEDLQEANYEEVSHWRDEDGNLLDEQGKNQAVQSLKQARERIRRQLQKGDYDETN